MHTPVYRHTRAHMYAHMNTHNQVHMQTHMCRHTLMHKLVCIYTTHTLMHTCAHTPYACVHTLMCPYTHLSMHTHSHAHTYTHALIHAFMHTHTYIPRIEMTSLRIIGTRPALRSLPCFVWLCSPSRPEWSRSHPLKLGWLWGFRGRAWGGRAEGMSASSVPAPRLPTSPPSLCGKPETPRLGVCAARERLPTPAQAPKWRRLVQDQQPLIGTNSSPGVQGSPAGISRVQPGGRPPPHTWTDPGARTSHCQALG